MPAVTVHTMFDLARIMGRHSAEIAVGPDATVRTVLEALIAAYDGLQGRLFDPGTGGIFAPCRGWRPLSRMATPCRC
jgi:hypothetical protein